MSSFSQSLTDNSHGFSAGSVPATTSSYTGTSSSLYQLPTTDSYFSIDDILATQQRIPVQFELPVYRLGFLNPSTNDEHLQAGTKMEVPFWLAKVLCSRRRQIVNVELPKSYRVVQRDILSADANVVDLYKLGPYYYSLGVKLLCFDHLEKRDLSKSLLETFLNRFRRIMDYSQNAFQSATTPLTTKLDETERKLFKVGQQATLELEKWEKGESHKITSSLVIQNSRKRKRQRSE